MSVAGKAPRASGRAHANTHAHASAAAAQAPGQRGFTLLEMMVALAIMALASGIGFPAFKQLLARRAMDAARNTVALALARAHSLAVTRDQPVSINLANGGGAAPAQLVFSGGIMPMPLPDGAAAEWPDGGIVIFGDGSTSGATGVIHAGVATSRFTIDPATAQTRFAS